MSVISGTGLVGRVKYVSAHFASILSILSQEQPVSAKLKDGTHGFSTWESEHPEVFIMKDMPQEAKIKKGDSVFTTSFGNVFPPDVLVGTVLKVDINKKNGLQQLTLKPAANFRSLQYVYAVDNAMLPEKKQLEDSSKTKK
jgi:rod shape-determining protein MreC